MFGKLLKQKEKPEGQLVVIQLNAKLQPMHRGEYFEDPLDKVLRKMKRGEISGGGSLLSKEGEIEYCDIEIEVADTSDEILGWIIEAFEKLGAPKGSKLSCAEGKWEIAFGVTEGLAVYLNGTDLPDAVYQDCDSNFVYSEFNKLLGDEGRVLSYWQGPTETALYIYGKSFSGMQQRLAAFIASYPLCEKCRIVQIA